jgi:hypothetical protein
LNDRDFFPKEPQKSKKPGIGIGTALAGCPSHRSVRAELPHTALTSVHDEHAARRDNIPVCHFSYAQQSARPGKPGSVSGPVATVGRSPWSAPFPPQTPRAASCLCSPASSVLWSCLTPRKRARRTCGIAPSPTDPPLARRMFPGRPLPR